MVTKGMAVPLQRGDAHSALVLMQMQQLSKAVLNVAPTCYVKRGARVQARAWGFVAICTEAGTMSVSPPAIRGTWMPAVVILLVEKDLPLLAYEKLLYKSRRL